MLQNVDQGVTNHDSLQHRSSVVSQVNNSRLKSNMAMLTCWTDVLYTCSMRLMLAADGPYTCCCTQVSVQSCSWLGSWHLRGSIECCTSADKQLSKVHSATTKRIRFAAHHLTCKTSFVTCAADWVRVNSGPAASQSTVSNWSSKA